VSVSALVSLLVLGLIHGSDVTSGAGLGDASVGFGLPLLCTSSHGSLLSLCSLVSCHALEGSALLMVSALHDGSGLPCLLCVSRAVEVTTAYQITPATWLPFLTSVRPDYLPSAILQSALANRYLLSSVWTFDGFLIVSRIVCVCAKSLLMLSGSLAVSLDGSLSLDVVVWISEGYCTGVSPSHHP